MMRQPHAVSAGLLVSLLALAACGTEQSVSPATDVPNDLVAVAARVQGPPAYVPGEVLVQFREGVTDVMREAVLQRGNARAAEAITTAAMRSAGRRSGVVLARTPGSVDAAIAALRNDPSVELAEPNWIYEHDAVSNDLYVTNSSLWGMYGATTTPANQFGSGAVAAWAAGKTDCSNVYVGIIDEGYYFQHTDLAANVGTNPGETAGNGRDDDGNGLIDDVYGWDFDGNNASVFDGAGDDHGTHVAGTIGGVGGNSAGVAGVCWRVKMMSAKFLGSRGGTTANAIRAVDYFTDLKTRHGLNLVATNNSWGGGGVSELLGQAIERANAAGILFIAAAGNSTLNCETRDCFPAEYPNANVIAVASITSTGALSSFSNFGATTIDLGAPGSGIISTVPVSSKGRISSGYANYSGTSMATPHVSGAAALYKALNPSANAAQVKAALLSSATPTASLTSTTLTGGRLNVAGF